MVNLAPMVKSEPDFGKIGFGPAELLPKEILQAKLFDDPLENENVAIG